MNKGFYCNQYEIAADLGLDVFDDNVIKKMANLLDEIEDVIPIKIDDENAPVSVASFLYGFCGNLASYFNNTIKVPIQISFDKEGNLVHAYNIINVDGKNYYLDSRGITDDKKLFDSFFGDLCCSTLDFDNVEEIRQKYQMWNEIFFEDEISNAMVNWLVTTYNNFYQL